MTAISDIRPKLKREVYYPESDGKPMGETDLHRSQISDLIQALEIYYENRTDVYVSGDNLIYYVEGNIKKFVSPDVYVVFGVENRLRNTYKVWEEGGHTPAFIIEVLSGRTKRNDLEDKYELYAKTLRVPEYYQFDVQGTYLNPRLRGYRLENGEYVPQEVVDNRLHSDALGLDLVILDGRLRLYDSASGEFLRTPKEEAHDRLKEVQRADAAEAEAARLRALLEALQHSQDNS